MLHNKNKAIELRKSGLSYRAIEKELHVPLSTLSSWFGGVDWSQKVSQDLLKKNAMAGSEHLKKFKRARGFALQFAYARAKEDAEKEYKKFKKHRLFIPGLILYWASGDQSSTYYIRLRSSNPGKVLLFRRFLEECLGVVPESIRYSLLLSYGVDETLYKGKWAQESKIPLQGFTKTTFSRKPRGKIPFPTSVCTGTYSSRTRKEKMLVWLRLVAQEFA